MAGATAAAGLGTGGPSLLRQPGGKSDTRPGTVLSPPQRQPSQHADPQAVSRASLRVQGRAAALPGVVSSLEGFRDQLLISTQAGKP